MKAYLSANGYLNIIPENDLESYALKMWWENYHKNGESSLLIHEITQE